MNIINNIGHLKQDLYVHNWHMTAFLFRYNNIEYDVLFENNDNVKNRVNPYASIILTFIDIAIPTRTYTIEANQIKLFFEPQEFREFFKIKYSTNLGDIFKQFFNHFLNFVPATATLELNERQNNEVVHCLTQREGHNPNAIYCYDARRLGKRNDKQMHRSIFISNLTELKKPILYNYFKDEPTVTFYYSENPDDELDCIEILNKFRYREQHSK